MFISFPVYLNVGQLPLRDKNLKFLIKNNNIRKSVIDGLRCGNSTAKIQDCHCNLLKNEDLFCCFAV